MRKREYFCKHCHNDGNGASPATNFTCNRCKKVKETQKEETALLRKFLRQYSPKISVKMGKGLETVIITELSLKDFTCHRCGSIAPTRQDHLQYYCENCDTIRGRKPETFPKCPDCKQGLRERKSCWVQRTHPEALQLTGLLA